MFSHAKRCNLCKFLICGFIVSQVLLIVSVAYGYYLFCENKRLEWTVKSFNPRCNSYYEGYDRGLKETEAKHTRK